MNKTGKNFGFIGAIAGIIFNGFLGLILILSGFSGVFFGFFSGGLTLTSGIIILGNKKTNNHEENVETYEME
ncbi:hypothetical protein [Spiroplasma monobiae]|uniref:Transmembrane protein n=1 Tax=Spiroplasma monobiae MQ-1 TaxID=1336748 RepID=A0A2K9LTK1_SPISQ|nr:hypothetical protein [Spiroplasma monobiae]AUM62330.1 hypothetical protein SMONO_v1c00770 [Spiroplasma monobiae MQ-1]